MQDCKRFSRLEQAECALLLEAADRCGYNKRIMADYIGVSVKTLYNWIGKYEHTLRDKEGFDRIQPKTTTARDTSKQEQI